MREHANAPKHVNHQLWLTAGEEQGRRGYWFRGEASISQLLAGLVGLPLMVASPTDNVETYWERPIVGDTRSAA